MSWNLCTVYTATNHSIVNMRGLHVTDRIPKMILQLRQMPNQLGSKIEFLCWNESAIAWKVVPLKESFSKCFAHVFLFYGWNCSDLVSNGQVSNLFAMRNLFMCSCDWRRVHHIILVFCLSKCREAICIVKIVKSSSTFQNAGDSYN